MQGNKDQTTRLLKTAAGQVNAALTMIEDDRYCVDISHQILASIALLKKANQEVLRGHIESCVKEAAISGDQSKIEEALLLVSKITG